MKDDDRLTFTVENEKGEQVPCEAIATFESEETGKLYIIYTDNSLDDERNTNVYASIVNPKNGQFSPIEDEEEWAIVDEVIAGLNED